MVRVELWGAAVGFENNGAGTVLLGRVLEDIVLDTS
jgi:hypothetical protein